VGGANKTKKQLQKKLQKKLKICSPQLQAYEALNPTWTDAKPRWEEPRPKQKIKIKLSPAALHSKPMKP
jgi:hypothetical protein